MEIEYSLTPEDMIAFQQYHVANPPIPPSKLRWPGWLWRIVFFVVLLVVVLSTATDRKPRDQKLQNEGYLGLLVCFGVVIVVVPITWFLQKRGKKKLIAKSVRQMLKEGNNARLLGPFRLSITPEGLQYTGALSSGFVNWAGVEKIAIAEDYAFIYVSTVAAHIIPSRVFDDDGAFIAFVATAKRYHEAAREK